MAEFAGIMAAFAVIMVMIKKKAPLALAMVCASLIVLLSSGKKLAFTLELFWSAVVDRDTVDLVLIVALVTALAALMNRHGFFDEMVTALGTMLRNDQLTLMIVPGLIGSMPMVGGAIVSAPIVDHIGEGLNLSRAARSAVNLIFRHSWHFVFPFMPTLILAARLADTSIQRLIWTQWPLAAVMLLSGYYFVLARKENPTPPACGRQGAPGETATPGAAVRSFLFHSSPIIISLVLHLGFGLHLALSLCVAMALAVILLTCVRRPEGLVPSSLPLQIIRDVDYPIAAAMAGIMIFRASVGETGAFNDLMTTMVGAGLPLSFITAALAGVMGFVSASHTSTVAVVVPVVTPIALSMGKGVLVQVTLAYSFALLAYLISPLHLCQILSNRYFGVSFGEVARLCLPVVIAVALATVGMGILHGGL
ncbi:MAG: DUF401 family protein [Bacillota bacterium]